MSKDGSYDGEETKSWCLLWVLDPFLKTLSILASNFVVGRTVANDQKSRYLVYFS